ncbi:hypothetical protein GcM1_072001, partial [Golovinomyces cichoracearum]
FRDFFHVNGIYTGKKSVAIGPALIALLQEEEFSCWPLDTKSSINSQQQQTAVCESIEDPEIKVITATPRLTPIPPQPHLQPQNLTPNLQTQYRSQLPNQQQQMPSPIQFPHQRQQSFPPSYQTQIRPFRQYSPYPWENDQPLQASNPPYPEQSMVNTAEGLGKIFDDYEDLPPREVPCEKVDFNIQTSFIKMWEHSPKYTGQAYDIFDDKVRSFLRICYNLNIQPQHFHSLFPRVLAGEAQAFYMDYIPKSATFYTQYTKL